MEYPSYLIHFNPNHDPKTGRFAPGNGKTSVSGKIGARLKKADLLNVDGPNAWRDFDNKTGTYSRLKAAADTGMKAMAKCGDKEPLDEDWSDWFLFEDQTFGMPEIADLANKGKTKDEIIQIIKDCSEYEKENPYTDVPGVWGLAEWNRSSDYYTVIGDNYIDACIEIAKENKQIQHSGTAQFGDYLCHYNKNHSSKNGQFTYGDGDNDGAIDERGRRGRYKPEAIGTHGNTSSVSQDDPQQKIQKFAIKTGLKIGVGGTKWLAGKAFARTSFGKQFNQIKSDWISVGRYTLANTDLKKAMATSNWDNYSNELRLKKAKFKDKLYDKATNKINDKLNEYSGG